MKAKRILKAWSVDLILVATFFAWAWAWDWVRIGDWQRSGKVLAGVAGISLMAAVYTCKRFHWTVGAFLGFVLLRWVSLRMPTTSLAEVTLIAGCIFAAVFIFQEDRKNLLGNCLAIDGFLQGALGLLEVMGVFPFFEIRQSAVWPPMAALGHPTILGPYLVCCLAFVPTAFHFLDRWPTARDSAQVAAAAMILACIMWTQSTMTMVSLAVLAVIGAGFYFGTRAMFALGAGLAVLGGCIIKLYPSAGSTTGRWPEWAWAWDQLTLLGYGPGTWFHVALQRFKEEGASGRPVFVQLHNDWLQGVFEFGWIGMLPLFIGLIVVSTITLRAVLLRRRELFPYAATFFSLAANALGNFPIHTMPMGALLAISAIYIFRYDFEEQAIRRHFESMERNL